MFLSIKTLNVTLREQEIIKVREVIPHTGPIPIIIPLRLFLDDINFPVDNVTARVTWKFRGGEKVQQILYDATLRFQNWVSCNISNTRRSVSSDIQTPRSELKNEAEGRVF